jgi:hypothetical protein
MKVLIVSKTPTHRTIAGNRYGILAQAEALERLGCGVDFLYVEELPLKGSVRDYIIDRQKTQEYWGERFKCFHVSVLQRVAFFFVRLYRKMICSDCIGPDDFFPVGLPAFVDKLHKQNHYDVCIVNYYYLTKLLKKIRIRHSAVFTHDYFAYKHLVVGERVQHLTAHSEALAMQRAESVFAVQDEECSYYKLIAPCSRVYNIYGRFTYSPQPLCGNHKLVFLSGGNPFNLNGIRWFVNTVWPSIQFRFSDAKLLIGGSICSSLGDLSCIDGVELQGLVDDPASFYAQADVAINPVYQGTGIKIKTFEAVSYDKITLVHPHSARGIFKSETAPIIVCPDVGRWVSELERIWTGSCDLVGMKRMNMSYIHALAAFIDAEYRRFIDDSKASDNTIS